MSDTTNTEMDGVLRRIKKLLAMANDGRGDVNEAAAAARMAEGLMRKFQLDHADIIIADLKKGDALCEDHVIGEMKADGAGRRTNPMTSNPSWAQHLAVAIARLNDCEVRQTTRPNFFGTPSAALSFYGFKADVQVCCWMFTYLLSQCVAAVRTFQAETFRDRTESDSFRKGFITIITARIYAQGEEKREEAKAAEQFAIGQARARGETSTALTLTSAKTLAIKEKFGSFGYKDSFRSTVRDGSAYAEGMRKAKDVDLNRRGISGSSSSSALKLN